MTIVAKELAAGQLPAARGDLYTVPGGTITYIKSITLHNTHSSVLTCTLTKEPTGSGTEYIIIKVELGIDETFYFNEPTILDATDVLRGDDGGTSAKVDYTISGAEES